MKKLLKKVISLTAALAMAAAYSASATVITGGGSSASDPYYWQEDFNDYTNTTASNTNLPTPVGKSGNWKTEITAKDTVIGTTAAHSYGDGNYALKASASGGTKGTNNSFLFINSAKTYNELFAGGDIIVSYDVRFTASNPKFRMQLVNTSGTNVVMGSYFQSSNGLTAYYTGGGTNPKKTGNVTTTVKNTDYNMTLLLHKLSDTEVQVRQFCNGTELVDTNGTTIELTTTLSSATTLDVKASLRFFVYSGTTAIIDNVTVRNASTVNLSNFGWINSTTNSASVGYTNTPAYMDSDSKTVTLTQGLINKIVAANESSQFTLKKYNLGDDPLLLSPTAQTAKVSYSGTNNFTIANLTLSDATKEFYIAKINDTSNFSSITGQATENEYVLLLNSKLASTPIIRETKLYGADGTVLALEGGKLPQNTNKIETVISYYSDVPTTVKIAGVGVNKSATVNGKTCTIDLSDSPLQPGQDYTITVGDVSKTYTATGEKAKMSEAIETFGDSASVTEQVCTSSYITLDKNGNKLLYKNTATSGLPELTYKFNNPFDFDGGNKKMLVSFKVELNQDIGYLNGEGVSHLLAPNVSIGSKTVYMPAIEHSGFRARTLPNGGRNGDKPEEYYIQTMTKNKVYYNSVLIEYDATSKTLKYTQYVDGKPMRLKPTNGDAYDVGTFEIENVTEDDLNANISILFQGRNFAAGGLYIDDLAVTTLGTDFNVLQPVIAADNTVTVDAVNKTESIYIMNIILASYKNNELLDVEYEKVKINFTDRQYKFTPSSEFNTTGATAVKAFVWNEFKNAVPYAANGEKKQ